jgi:hypothetical protein
MLVLLHSQLDSVLALLVPNTIMEIAHQTRITADTIPNNKTLDNRTFKTNNSADSKTSSSNHNKTSVLLLFLNHRCAHLNASQYVLPGLALNRAHLSASQYVFPGLAHNYARQFVNLHFLNTVLLNAHQFVNLHILLFKCRCPLASAHKLLAMLTLVALVLLPSSTTTAVHHNSPSLAATIPPLALEWVDSLITAILDATLSPLALVPTILAVASPKIANPSSTTSAVRHNSPSLAATLPPLALEWTPHQQDSVQALLAVVTLPSQTFATIMPIVIMGMTITTAMTPITTATPTHTAETKATDNKNNHHRSYIPAMATICKQVVTRRQTHLPQPQKHLKFPAQPQKHLKLPA